MVLILQSVDEILKSDHSVESYRAVLSCGVTSYYSLPLSLRNIYSRVLFRKALNNLLFPVNFVLYFYNLEHVMLLHTLVILICSFNS